MTVPAPVTVPVHMQEATMCECQCGGCQCGQLRDNYVIVRTRSAGVFAGVLPKDQYCSTVTLLHARRLWYWKGAASLSELSVRGVKCPVECKFPAEVASVFLPEVIEILQVTPEAQRSIHRVKEWKA